MASNRQFNINLFVFSVINNNETTLVGPLGPLSSDKGGSVFIPGSILGFFSSGEISHCTCGLVVWMSFFHILLCVS
jgi:hypothetical protein